MRHGAILILVLFGGLATARPALGQPVLERLERSIRQRLGEPIPPPEAGDPTRRPTDRQAQPPAPQADDARTQPGYLGVLADEAGDRDRGVRVLEVRSGGPAEEAGFAKDDLITAVAGIRVRTLGDMADVLQLFSPGESVTFEVLRGQQRQEIKVTLGRRPPPQPSPSKGLPRPPLPRAAAPPAAGPPKVAPPRPPPEDAEPGKTQPTLEQLARRIEQLERRVAELERALAEALKKP